MWAEVAAEVLVGAGAFGRAKAGWNAVEEPSEARRRGRRWDNPAVQPAMSPRRKSLVEPRDSSTALRPLYRLRSAQNDTQDERLISPAIAIPSFRTCKTPMAHAWSRQRVCRCQAESRGFVPQHYRKIGGARRNHKPNPGSAFPLGNAESKNLHSAALSPRLIL